MVDSKSIIEKIKSITGYSQKEVAAEIFGISDKNLSNKIRRGSIDLDALIKWAGNVNVDLNWLLTGKGGPYLSLDSKVKLDDGKRQPSPSSVPKASEISDAEIIEQFSDKRYAKELNSSLVELEQLNQQAFQKVGPYIKGLLEGLRMPRPCCQHTGPDRRVAQRRVKDDPKKYKGAKDRRSGKERRVAAQR
jgi:transcriptional regulator with XRE-family HTH domain